MEAKQALVDRLKQATNILVTVSSNPSVDQLASCIGLTLALNKLDKHATAVFSGAVPSTIEFLQPEKTIEKDTNSLRDFIIALDKSKADKLRYKVEDKVVKIFITPYRTSISEKDLNFSQGDFNVDAVVALGVHNQSELDQAITSHGRILHDATVTTINVKPGGELGTINWLDPKASSLSELVAELVSDLGQNLIDEQMATALLTGIVAETQRFSNDRTSPTAMTISAELMAAGANQQLVATKLEPPVLPSPPPEPSAPAPVPEQLPAEPEAKTAQPTESSKPDDGTLEINHGSDLSQLEDQSQPNIAQINIDEQGALKNVRDMPQEPPKGNTDPTKHMEGQHMILEPPSMGGQLTASIVPEGDDEEKPAGDPLASPSMSQNNPGGFLEPSASPFSPPASATIGAPPPVFASNAPSPIVSDPGAAALNDDNPYPSPFSTDTVGPASPAPSAASLPQLQPFQPVTPPPSVPVPQPVQGGSVPPSPSTFTPAEPPAPFAPPTPGPVVPGDQLPPPSPFPATITAPGQTLTEIEKNVNSPHVQQDGTPGTIAPTGGMVTPTPVEPSTPSPSIGTPAAPSVDNARDAVMQAFAQQSATDRPEPIQALNAQPLGDPLHETLPEPTLPTPPSVTPPADNVVPPPPGPPPMMPPTQ